MLTKNLRQNLGLMAICTIVGMTIYMLGLASVLWSSMLISLGVGFTARYSNMALQYIAPQMPLKIQFIIAGLIAVVLWGGVILPLATRYGLLSFGLGFDFWSHLPLLLMLSVATVIISYFYYSREQFFLLQQDLDKAEINRVKQEVEALEIRWRLLQSQLEPHFLFNTLANIQALIKADPKQASDMLLALTSLLRQNLNNTREDWMRLADELRFNKAYLAIQKIRLGERLQVHLDIDEKVRDDLLVPPMLLQPMIENAVVHGIEPLKRGGALYLKITVEKQQLLIRLYNDGSMGSEDDSHRGHNVGLSNTRARLKHLYGESAHFSIGEQAPHGVVVKMEIPCRYTTAP